MSKVAVVYWSATGNTKQMAEAIEKGVTENGGEASLIEAGSFDSNGVKFYDSFALGCPAMGAEVLEETEFQPMYDGIKSGLSGKKVALFGSYGWGDGQWMRDWEEDCKKTGCKMLGTIIANGTPDDEALENCKNIGNQLSK